MRSEDVRERNYTPTVLIRTLLVLLENGRKKGRPVVFSRTVGDVCISPYKLLSLRHSYRWTECFFRLLKNNNAADDNDTHTSIGRSSYTKDAKSNNNSWYRWRRMKKWERWPICSPGRISSFFRTWVKMTNDRFLLLLLISNFSESFSPVDQSWKLTLNSKPNEVYFFSLYWLLSPLTFSH